MTTEKPFRKFGGKIDNFESKDEQRLEKKHLKAYLRGNTYFKYGFTTNEDGMRIPAWHKVKIIYPE